MNGTVKFFNTQKGYGFIEPQDGGRDIFVHVTKVAGGLDLRDGMAVEFETVDSKKPGKGPEAINVRVA